MTMRPTSTETSDIAFIDLLLPKVADTKVPIEATRERQLLVEGSCLEGSRRVEAV
jgi:hypothetical protein